MAEARAAVVKLRGEHDISTTALIREAVETASEPKVLLDFLSARSSIRRL